jgi:hypothetical protein
MTGTMSRLAVAVVLVCACAVEGFAPMAAPAGGRHGSAARAIPALRVPRSGQASAARSQVVMQVELFGSQGSRSPLVRDHARVCTPCICSTPPCGFKQCLVFLFLLCGQVNWYLHELNTPFQMAPRERCAGVCVCVASTAARHWTRARVSVCVRAVVSALSCGQEPTPVWADPMPQGREHRDFRERCNPTVPRAEVRRPQVVAGQA